MGRTQAILFTWTTYGTWLRGDMRGWVDEGRVLPADPVIEAADRARMKHSIFTFKPDQLFEIGQAIGDSLRSRMALRIIALTIQTWHVHLLIAATSKSLLRHREMRQRRRTLAPSRGATLVDREIR